MEQNKLSPAFSRTTEQQERDPTQRTNEYVTALDFLKNENLSQLENWKPVSQKHKKLALAVENLQILLDLDAGRF